MDIPRGETIRYEDSFIGRPNTVATYKSLIKKHIYPFNPPENAVRIAKQWSEADTSQMLRIWQEKELAPRTIQMLLRLLRDFIKYHGGPAIEIKRQQGVIARSEQSKELTVLNKEQAAQLMGICRRLEPQYYPIMLLGLHAGLRRGEVFGLRCGDICLLKNQIRVAHNYDGPTKNGKIRYVPMSTELQHAMVEARNLVMRPVDKKVFEVMNPNPHLRRLCAHAKLPNLRFHDLRHTFATLALENDVSPRQVADWLGHSSVNTTLSIYWNLIKQNNDVDNFLPGREQ